MFEVKKACLYLMNEDTGKITPHEAEVHKYTDKVDKYTTTIIVYDSGNRFTEGYDFRNGKVFFSYSSACRALLLDKRDDAEARRIFRLHLHEAFEEQAARADELKNGLKKLSELLEGTGDGEDIPF